MNKMRNFFSICIVLTFIFASLSNILIPELSFAYRPLGTEDVGVAGKGVTQMEMSWEYLKWKKDDREQIFLLVLIYGVSERLEASAELPYLLQNPKERASQEGIGDMNLVAKYLFLQETEKTPAFTVKGMVKLDNGNFEKGLGSGDRDYSLFAVASKNRDNLSIHAHFGQTWIGNKNNKNMRDITLYGLAIDAGVTENFHLLGEINGNRHPDIHEANDPRNALMGATYRISSRLTLDMAYKWGISDASPEWNTSVGMTITF
ncbi:MAG: transporter [Nitrospinota bacterium]